MREQFDMSFQESGKNLFDVFSGFLTSPCKLMFCTKIDHSRRKTLNSGSDLTEWVLLYTHTPRHKKHEPSKLNCYTFSDELTPLDMKSLSSPLQMDVVYEN